MIEGRRVYGVEKLHGWGSQGRDVSCLITMANASLCPNTNSEANAHYHRNADCRIAPYTALSISVDIANR